MMAEAVASPRCPVCRAAFRGTSVCSRCGADLLPVMTLMTKARIVREASRAALRAGDATRALDLARRAQALCATEAGRRLQVLARWGKGGRGPTER